ncbi:DUF6879 family protein [Streptomyces sp. NPDC050085]|uniref:DUF6879 family protein n=1 Tax=Streptomyces sp. NPDC050085 TaxID=3365600 RepID=UPI0037A85C66
MAYLDKVECGQEFQEPGFDSWEACRSGAWNKAVDLLGDQPALDRHFSDAARRRMRQRRLRYIECPPTDYIVWEMAVLNERVARGEQIRIASVDTKPGFQAPPPRWFSELVILGTLSLYELRYNQDGILAGAYRHTGQELISGCRKDFDELYQRGEEFDSFHQRVTQPLLDRRRAEAAS